MKKSIVSTVIVFLFASASALRAENIGVPAECEDVMLQVFYWDSYKNQTSTDSKYGRTKWIDLLKDTTAITANFDLVWFPPSASSTGGVGYYHACLSNQESAWGTPTALKNLIRALHRGNTKVLADIVINHRGNKSSWCDFYEDKFGSGYGSFQLTQQHICSGDECFTTSGSTCYGAAASDRGAADTGTNDGGCRDLDHTNTYVQNWAKTYTQWMLNVMMYDGFRYDMTRGYHGRYLSMYNEAANPYFSVSEYWEGIDNTVKHLRETNFNTMIFDFPLKQGSIANGLGKYFNYSLLKNPTNSLRGKGYGKYAVTFIDNHDTFERSDNQGGEFYQYNADLQNPTTKRKILEANAYILMLPGVPCVFWPHWKSYRDEINALIAVRKEAGIHSESAVTEEIDRTLNTYEAAVQGHNGRVILRMGPNRSKEVPAGYVLALEGGDVAEYTIFYAAGAQGIESVDGSPVKGEKFIENGRLYIRTNETVYDIMGQRKK